MSTQVVRKVPIRPCFGKKLMLPLPVAASVHQNKWQESSGKCIK
jgi:hypothetical protein